MRIKIFRILIALFFFVIVLDLIYVQVFRGRMYYHLSTNNRIRVVPIEGWRGRIFDRNGVIMSDNRMSYNVMVTPQDILHREELFRFLSEVLIIKEEILYGRFLQGKFAAFAPVVVAQDIGRKKAIILEESKYRFPSLIVDQGFMRHYPLKKNSAHVLGYVGKINRSKIKRLKEYGFTPQSIIGYSGVEEYYDAYLKGASGGSQIEVNSHGQQVRLLSLKEPKKGQDIVLTIDTDLQDISANLMGGARATIIVMNIENGEILGMTSSPAFDPNVFVDSRYRRKAAILLNRKDSPLINRAINGVFPPGSVFKALVALAGLDSQKIHQNTTFVCDGFYEVGGLKFKYTHIHGPQNLVESIAHSCNVYFYRLGKMLGADLIYQYAHNLGLGEITHIDLPFEKAGFIPSKRYGLKPKTRRWYTGDTLNLSIGQGQTLTTPLQLVRMMATIAGDGVEVQPHIIKKIGEEPMVEHQFKQKVKMKARSFDVVKRGLRATVTDYSGTAHALDIGDLYIAGKTGTAQTSGNQPEHSWFVGYALSQKKKIAFCVFLEFGGSSQNAVLMARQLLLRMQQRKMI